MIAIGVATYTRHDAHTRHVLADFTTRLGRATDSVVLDAAAALERPNARRHPLCGELRQIVDKELTARHLSLASIAEVA
ncbi:MAG TPA: hypothetical protein VIQ30_00665 [Pseudonocardia sp.]